MNNQAVFGTLKGTEVFEQPRKGRPVKGQIPTSSYSDEYLKEVLEYEEDNLLSENLKLEVGQICKGNIYSITSDELIVDLNAKEFVYVSLQKDKLNASEFSVGEEVTFLITDKKGNLKGSITEGVKSQIYQELRDSDEKTVFKAKVLDLSDNGYVLDIKGLKVFMPGSLGGINKLHDFTQLLGKEINVIPVKNQNKYSSYSNHIIVSHREYLKTLIPGEIETLEVGSVYTGRVTDTAKFGIFVEFNDVLTGLIHKDEFDDMLKNLFESGQVKPGVEIDFYLKKILSKDRLVLTRNFESIGEEEGEKETFRKGQLLDGVVSKIVTYGAFVKIGENSSGLIHIDRLQNIKLTRGEKIRVKVLFTKDDKISLDLV